MVVQVDCNDPDEDFVISECEESLGQESVGGQAVLRFLDVEPSAGENMAILVGFVLFFRIAAYFSLRFIVHGKARM